MDYNALQDTFASTNGRLQLEQVNVRSQYTLLEQIGKGSYGVVWRARRCHGDKGVYAIKQISKRHAGTKGLREVMGEVETMSLLTHPNIVKLEETFQDDANLWIVMEYIAGGELQHLIKGKPLPEATARRIIVQLVMAVEYIHDKGIVHRDLKPTNCLLSKHDFTVKISDFGFAVLVGVEQCLTTFCGTTAFMAPEILLDKNYGKPVDMWAIGVMTYLVFLGEYPFAGRSLSALTRQICRNQCNLDHERLRQFPLLRDFISRLLTADPNKRLTAKEALRHPWIRSGVSNNNASSLRRTRSLQSVRRNVLRRLRVAAIAVMSMHRLRFLQQCHRLAKLGYANLAILHDFHYLITGKYEHSSLALLCAHTFEHKPLAILELLPMIESCEELQYVDLSSNGIDNLGVVQSLLRVISKHPSITTLNLSHNPIPPLAGRALVRLARNSASRVTQICVDDTNLPQDTVNQIHSALKERAALLLTTTSLSKALVHEVVSEASATPSLSTSMRTCSDQQYLTPYTSGSSRIRRRKNGRCTKLPPIPHFAQSRRNEV